MIALAAETEVVDGSLKKSDRYNSELEIIGEIPFKYIFKIYK